MLSPIALMAQTHFFTDKNVSQFSGTTDLVRPIKPKKFRSIFLDVNGLKQFLNTVPLEFSADAASRKSILALPMPYGGFANFSIVESPMQEPGLAAKFPDIKTYSGQGIDDKTATIKLDWTGFGFHAQILSPLSGAIYIDPYSRGNVENYMSYFKKDLKPSNNYEEVGLEGATDASFNTNQTTSGYCFSQLRSYRFAVACTGEYAAAVGGSTPSLLHSAIVTTVNRVNGVYEQEVAVRLILVSNNNLNEYLNASTDPFTGNNNANVLINESHSVITSNIGTANFDIGHTFSTGGGGLAGLGVVCNSGNKGRGITGSSNPTGDGYDIDFVAHEVGHQFGGNHTFNSTTGSCGGGNRSASSAVEPGSGITIMGYAGICGSNDLEPHSIANFHTKSQEQIGTYAFSGFGSTCGTLIATNNTAPVVNAGSDYVIPANTPFMLTGSAVDAEGDVMTYSWEQYDLGTAGNWNSGNNPLFRSFVPKVTPTRFFPKLQDILDGTTTIGEMLPPSARTMNFRLTTRDNRSGAAAICSDEMIVTVVNSSGFNITSQNTITSWTANGTNTATVSWNVAGTNTGAINTPNVTILFSADGGQTFPYTIVTSTPNDGSEDIIIPSVKTTNGRIMVKGAGNIFFDINGAAISINPTCGAVGAVVSPSVSVVKEVGSPDLNLNLQPSYTSAFNVTGNISTSDALTNLVQATGGLTCIQYSNDYRYDVYAFTASVSGAYVITRTGSAVFNIYVNSFDPSNLCNNWITSNLQGSSLSNGVSVFLTAGMPYYLVVGVYYVSGNPVVSLPHNYTFNMVTGPGVLYNGAGIYSDPGSNYTYKYVIVDNATNNIKAISSTSDLSNSSTYPVGTYTVYGISYLTAHSATINGFAGGSFASLTNAITNNPGTACADLSRNAVSVIIKGVLPVTFTELTAKKKENNVVLNWGTVTEINNSHFEIERSDNGKDFKTKIGTIASAGNSSSVKNYSIVDASPIKGLNYYRVKQVDNDGKFSYSNIAVVNFERENSNVIVYPNPAKHTLNMEFTAFRNNKISVQILDTRGAEVLQTTYSTVVGRNIQTINVSSLTKGIYILKVVDADGKTMVTKFVKD